MKKGLLLMILLISVLHVFGQGEYGFAEGVIITKQNDTIRCYVELAITYGDSVVYKKSATGQKQSISSIEVKSITTAYKHWENITLGKKEQLMSLLVDGKARLFNHVTLNFDPYKPGNEGPIKYYDDPTVIYILRKDEVNYELKKKDFKEQLRQTLNDCQAIMNKVNSKEYKYSDLEKIVTEYNSCH